MGTNEATLSSAIVRLMTEHGFSLAQISKVLALHPSEMTRINRGEREFKADQLLEIARHLKLPLAGVLARAMAPYDEPVLAGERLAKLLSSVTDEVDAILSDRNAPKPGAKRATLLEKPGVRYGSDLRKCL